ncbi:hypothetical protein Leryth_006731 [Lithospermum erythrorhizon]|nr:hypothetical protein Leryth_006731 [Lithospermum erythrorhizon]
MKFGETFTEYLQGEKERFLDNCSHVEYKRLKKVLKRCRTSDAKNIDQHSCQFCDETFFTELMKEASDVAGCFRSRVRRLLHLHSAPGVQRCLVPFRQCFRNDHQAMVQECGLLIKYVAMNAIAMRKILKKYDKVHGSANGMKFKSKLHSEHIEILQTPWLIELGAFYLNSDESVGENSGVFDSFSCEFDTLESLMVLTLPGPVKLEYNLTCAVCLDLVFNPFALSCGHLFCKSCACSAASVMIFQGLKTANAEAKCPICREAGVYASAVHMVELHMLVKNRCNEYWKERVVGERAETVKQSKTYWDMQTKNMIGY